MLNIPKRLVEKLRWEMGDNISVVEKNNGIIELQKVADKTITKDEIVLPALQGEAGNTFASLYVGGQNMDPATFSNRLSGLTRALARMRKNRQRIQK